jgi:hypothetical protein
MSTRAVITIKDSSESFHVYQHCDGYPAGIADTLQNAVGRAWALPRFEACEFAAALVAANKSGAGNIYLSKGPRFHGDLDYAYIVTVNSSKGLQITVKRVSSGRTVRGVRLSDLAKVDI